MGDIAVKISSGGTPLKSNDLFYNGTIPWLRTQEVTFNKIYKTGETISQLGFDSSSAKWISVNSIIVAMVGASVGRVAINMIPLTTNQNCCSIELDKEYADYRYVFHYLSHSYNRLKSSAQGTQNFLSIKTIAKITIPIPPLEEQKRIADILDKFDALVNDISSGLPAEIAARRQQYEYYRDALLTFPTNEE